MEAPQIFCCLSAKMQDEGVRFRKWNAANIAPIWSAAGVFFTFIYIRMSSFSIWIYEFMYFEYFDYFHNKSRSDVVILLKIVCFFFSRSMDDFGYARELDANISLIPRKRIRSIKDEHRNDLKIYKNLWNPWFVK